MTREEWIRVLCYTFFAFLALGELVADRISHRSLSLRRSVFAVGAILLCLSGYGQFVFHAPEILTGGLLIGALLCLFVLPVFWIGAKCHPHSNT